MNPVPLCLHCESAPQSQEPRLRGLRLCERCGARHSLRRLYRRPRGWTPAWDAHLQRLVERAKLGLPVCIDEAGYVIPFPPDRHQRRECHDPRIVRFSRRRRKRLGEG
jgi:hypothetical protein